MKSLERLKVNIREGDVPFFTDEELVLILEEAGFDLRRASYMALIRKAENDGVRLPSGLTVSGNRDYWLSLARQYRPGLGRVLVRKDG
ncbi:MAG: hypothetical protein FWE29_04925 [Defluviitaleaceae bacterium]|nr:hypothetical protein [Defluviitaleaceae bacterium]